MTLKELVDNCVSSNDEWPEILVFDNENEFEKYIESGDKLGIQFTMKGELSIISIKDEILAAEVEYFSPTGKNTIAVCCLDMPDILDNLFKKDE